MKSPKKITKVQLAVNDIDEPWALGIVSSDPDYKISLKINRQLNIALKNTTASTLEGDNGEMILFSRFSDLTMLPETSIVLVSNRSGKSFLLKKLRNIDYLFLIYDNEKRYTDGWVTDKLKEIDSVTAIFRIDLKTLNDKNKGILFQ